MLIFDCPPSFKKNHHSFHVQCQNCKNIYKTVGWTHSVKAINAHIIKLTNIQRENYAKLPAKVHA